MANYQAIAAVSEGVIQLLRTNYKPELFNDTELDFKVYVAQDFASPMLAGVSLFPYRVFHNGTHRQPAGRMGVDGKRQKAQLPLELHFILTAWGRDPSLQNTIAGWMMRTMEDTPTLGPSLLNSIWPNVFSADETIEIVLGEMSTEDMFQMWDVLTERGYSLSVPYVARILRIESVLSNEESEVRSRNFGYGNLQEQ